MRYVLLAAVALCFSCDQFETSMQNDTTVPLPKDCMKLESADVMEVGSGAKVRCKVVCNDTVNGATVHIGDCTSRPNWKVVRFKWVAKAEPVR
jgi:hypothetical protein